MSQSEKRLEEMRSSPKRGWTITDIKVVCDGYGVELRSPTSGFTSAVRTTRGTFAFALAGGFMSQTFSTLKDGTIRGGVGQLQFADESVFEGIEEKTLEHAVTDGERAASILRRDPAVDAILPRIDFLGLISNGTRSIPFLWQ